MTRLSVNIDKFALLRNSRGGDYPNVALTSLVSTGVAAEAPLTWALLALTLVILIVALFWGRSMHRARRAQQEELERVTRLHAMTVALAEVLTAPEVARVIVDQSARVLGADAAVVAVVDESGDELEILGSRGFEPQQVEGWRRFPRRAPTAIAELVERREPVFLDEVAASAKQKWALLAAVPGVRAIAAMPLLRRSRCLGVLGLSFRRRRPLDNHDRAFLQDLAHQGALALERARLQEGAARARATAEAASLAREEFLAAVSHELRTPLNAVLGWAQMLRTGRVEPDEVPRALEAIEQNARAQARLVKDLIDVSRTVRDRLQHAWEAVDLGTCLDAALGTVRPAADDKRLTLVVRREERGARVRGDAARLQQVFWNVLTNAVKFTPAGGRIDIALGYTAHEAILRVTDSGDGMEPDRVPAMFERFSQADSSRSRSQGGLGLGLAIVRHLVEAHHGSVHATSEGRGHGSTFLIRLPLDRGASAGEQTSVDS